MLSECFITNFLKPYCTISDGNETTYTYIESEDQDFGIFCDFGSSMIENACIILKIPLKSMLNQ